MSMVGPTCVSASKIRKLSRAIVWFLPAACVRLFQTRAEPQRVLPEQLASGGGRQARPTGDLLDTLGPRGVPVRPVGREEPDVFAEGLNAELDRALPRVDRV